MLSKKYADTDFFLALVKESDWLKARAIEIYRKEKENIFVSPFTLAEIMIVCKRESLPIREILTQISRISKLDNISWEVFFKAADFVESGAGVFDSLLMAFASEDSQIISSDRVYEKFGFKVVDLKS